MTCVRDIYLHGDIYFIFSFFFVLNKLTCIPRTEPCRNVVSDVKIINERLNSNKMVIFIYWEFEGLTIVRSSIGVDR